MQSVHNTKSSVSLVSDTLTRTVSTTAILFVVVAVMALLRGVSQDVHYPLASDDWYLVAGYLSLWCLVPALLATIISAFSRVSRSTGYMLAGLLQVILLFGYSYQISNQPDNELGSSPLMLLVYLAIPVAAVYYPLFFVGRPLNKARLAAIIAAVILISYSVSS